MGSLSKPLEVLTVADVNIRAMCMADTSEFGILRLVVDDPIKGKEALEENNFLVKITEIIGVEMNDTPGGLTTVLGIIKDNLIDLEYLYFNKLKGETLSASHYRSKGFEQNVNDCDFFEKSIIFQPYDDSTFNYQYCYQDLINYPYMK